MSVFVTFAGDETVGTSPLHVSSKESQIRKYACGVYLSSLSINTVQQTRTSKSFLHAVENATQYERSSVRDERWIGISPLAGQEICVRWFLCGKHVVLAKVTQWPIAPLICGSISSGLVWVHTWPLSALRLNLSSLSPSLCVCVCACATRDKSKLFLLQEPAKVDLLS